MPKVPESLLLMAAAEMHSQGRLLEPRDPFAGNAPPEQLKHEQDAFAHAEKQGMKPGEIFDFEGSTFVWGGNGAMDYASEQQVIEHSNKALRKR